MASSFLGPESPRPYAVISEGYRNRLCIPTYSNSEQYDFGKVYDNAFYNLLQKYTDLDTTDRFCYVGDVKENFVEKIANKFCLLEPVMTVIPGHYSYVETDSQKVLSLRIAQTGAEEYFRQLKKSKDSDKLVFDKIMLKDAIRYFENPKETYANIMGCLAPGGQLLIVHRPSNLNTLPLFGDAKERLETNETPYMDIINDLQECKLDIQWEMECLPLIISKRKWFSMLKEKFPPMMEIMSDSEITSGVRELSEGILKYEGENVELVDRLLFISVSKSKLDEGFPKLHRYGQSENVFPDLRDLKFSMELTEEIKPFVSKKNYEHKKTQRR
ncbi:unnamed protein product [Mytilus coruscus]|uniref:Uncharacterized protein n=1 Tax=Mytilus coruscus TaxID=42192 RepID=A0A6J8DAL9_MYTCO|nr:unnamed protein product [Mytilus coruscus]